MTDFTTDGPDFASAPQADSAQGATQADTPNAVALSPFYLTARNEILQPDKFSAHSHYLTRRWKRELGPNGYAILASLRERCYCNRKTGERRETLTVRLAEIADECGVSERTVRRELAENAALRRFVQAQREADRDARTGGFLFGPSSYRVAMDDPLHPLDEPEMLELVRRKAEEADKTPADPVARARRRAAEEAAERGQTSTCGQIDRTSESDPERAVNLSATSGQFVHTSGQIDRTLTRASENPKNHYLRLLKISSSGESLSLFEERTGETVAERALADAQTAFARDWRARKKAGAPKGDPPGDAPAK